MLAHFTALLVLACIVLAIVAPLTLAGVHRPLGTVWNPALQKFTQCYTGARCTSDVCDIDGTCAQFKCTDDSHCFPGTSCIEGVCGVRSAARKERAVDGDKNCGYDNLCIGDGQPDMFCNNADDVQGGSMTKVTGTCMTMRDAQAAASAANEGKLPNGWFGENLFTKNNEVLFSNMASSEAYDGRGSGGGMQSLGSDSKADFNGAIIIKRPTGAAAGSDFRIVQIAEEGNSSYDVVNTASTYNIVPIDIGSAKELQYAITNGGLSESFACVYAQNSFLQPCGPAVYTFAADESDPAVMLVFRDAANTYAFQVKSGSDTGRYLAIRAYAQGFTTVSAVGKYVTTVAANAPTQI